jgi:hypothetical protein
MITLDNISSSILTGYAAGATYNFTHISAKGAKLLVVGVSLWQDAAGTGTVTGITYAGKALSLAIARTVSGGAIRSEIWYLENPTMGANTVAVTISGDTDARKFSAVTLLGSKATPFNQSNYTDGGDTSSSCSVTTTDDEEILFDVLTVYGATAPSNNQTTVMADTTGSTLGGMSWKIKAPAGAQAMQWSWTTAGDSAQVVASFRALTAGMKLNFLRPRVFRPGLAR